MHQKIRIVGSLVIVIAAATYLAWTKSRGETSSVAEQVTTNVVQAATASKLETLRSLTDGALSEQRTKLADLDRRITETSTALETLKGQRNDAQVAVKNIEKVIANLGGTVPTPELPKPTLDKETADRIAQAAKAADRKAPPTKAANTANTANSTNAATTAANPQSWKSLIERVNKTAGKEVVRSDDDRTVTVSGTGLILVDKSRPRIGQKAIDNVSQVLQKLRGKKIEEVQIRVQEGTADSHVALVRNYLERTYGWKIRIENVDSSAATLAPIEIGITGK
ncbi:MAG: hypothetical protein V4760_11245 [Bdellovibrionota bacterium]